MFMSAMTMAGKCATVRALGAVFGVMPVLILMFAVRAMDMCHLAVRVVVRMRMDDLYLMR